MPLISRAPTRSHLRMPFARLAQSELTQNLFAQIIRRIERLV